MCSAGCLVDAHFQVRQALAERLPTRRLGGSAEMHLNAQIKRQGPTKRKVHKFLTVDYTTDILALSTGRMGNKASSSSSSAQPGTKLV